MVAHDPTEEIPQGPGHREAVEPGLPVGREHDPTLHQLSHHLTGDRRVLPEQRPPLLRLLEHASLEFREVQRDDAGPDDVGQLAPERLVPRS